MSKRYNSSGPQYQNRPQAAELHDLGAHAHRTGAEHGQQDHLTGQEQSRQALEHSRQAFLKTQQEHQDAPAGHGITPFGHEDIAKLAYELWQERGCPEGSPDEDWLHAIEQLRSRN